MLLRALSVIVVANREPDRLISFEKVREVREGIEGVRTMTWKALRG